ncbi:hypothetical protein, partial [Myroides sp. N17-2]|uniref:hypothetical protein n=1 Tax=Myroides sp. N17-2 TaxID=2030799 RepID=UPI000EFBD848
MKKKLLFASVAFMALNAIHAQDGVGIGKSVVPNGTAVLDVDSDTKGVLIPRVFLTGEKDVTTIKGGVFPESLLVYHKAKLPTDVLKSGFYFWDGTLWRALMSKSSEHLSETLTTLEVKQEAGETVLVYKDEKGNLTNIEISKELLKSTNFETWVKNLVNSTAAGVVVEEGTGITVTKTDPVGNSTVTTYTVAAKLNEIALTGDVSGMADSTSVDKIKGVVVDKADPAKDNGLALVYDGAKWAPGKPKVDGGDITDKVTITVDNSIELTGGTDAVLSATGLKVKALGINDTHLAADAVTTVKIKDANVTKEKIKGEGNDKVLTTNATGDVVWVAQNTIKPTATTMTVDNSIELTGGTDAVLSATDLKVRALGINATHLAKDAVVTDKIADANVTKEKIKGEGNDKVLTTNATGDVVWVAQNTIKPTATTMTVDNSIEMTGGTDAVLSATGLKVKALGINDAHLAADAVTTVKIKDANVTPGKIEKGTANQVLVTSADGTKVEWAEQSRIKPTAAAITVDNSIEMTGGTDAVLSATGLKVKALGITEGHLANNAVTTLKIADANVTKEKIKGEGNDKVLTTSATGDVVWVAQNTIKPTAAAITVDNSIEMTGGTDAVLSATGLKVKALGINDTHLAADAVTTVKIKDANVTPGKIEKGTANQVLVTSADGTKVEWAEQSRIKPTAAAITVDNSIEMTGGTDAVLSATGLKVKALGINDTHLASNAVTTDKILNANVTPAKIAPGTSNQVLVTSADGLKTEWVDKNAIQVVGVTPTVDGSIDMTGGTNAMLSATGLKVKALGINDTHLAADAVTTVKIKDANVTPGKIEKGTANQVLVTSADGTKVEWAEQSRIKPTAAAITVDNSIEMTGGTDAVLSATGLKVKALGINDTHLAADAVTTVKIKDANVTPGKIEKGTANQVLVTSADGTKVEWA